MKKVVIAPDSFKGSFNAFEVADAIKQGIEQANLPISIEVMPLADGGEGTVDAFVQATNGTKHEVEVFNAFQKNITAYYGVLGDGETCIIEMAEASGLSKIDDHPLNPLKATSYGTGQLIKEGLDVGYRRFILGLGGSATNDGGVGMLHALGAKFLNRHGEEIGLGAEELYEIDTIDLTLMDSRIASSQFTIASDVTNPLVGPFGASNIFGPQKGATQEMIEKLEQGLHQFANVIEEQCKVRIHEVPGSGAAGGLGAACIVFLHAKMTSGIDLLLETVNFDQKIKSADLVISGEGKIDAQTIYGKTAYGVAKSAQHANVPTILLAGAVEGDISPLYDAGVIGVYSILQSPANLQRAIRETKQNLTYMSNQIVRTFFH